MGADRQGSAGYEIRVRGTVQGVGFRPSVWRLASQAGLRGDVRNDASGVRIRLVASMTEVEHFVRRLREEAPPLSRIDGIEVEPLREPLLGTGFHIVDSARGEARTQVTPDAAVCEACRDETSSPAERRFRYPFTNCTHCGPRFSIVRGVPYDRARTSMASFAMCTPCAAEYGAPADRRFHAQPIACPECGPKAWLVHIVEGDTTPYAHASLDDLDAVGALLMEGRIVAIRGLGGFHLACDATRDRVVQTLRRRKRRDTKPFALMARDIDIVRDYCAVDEDELSLLQSPEAPIVLLRRKAGRALPDAIAPGLDTLGFMLPYTPLHLLVLRDVDRPVVMTSANLSDAPQVTQNDAAATKLAGIADYGLFHDREIVNRIDDSVVRVVGGRPRIIRRARGYAPAAISLPPGFEGAPDLLAFGGELKATFCMVKDGSAVLSQHQGDLEDLETYEDYEKNLALYRALYDHKPRLFVADRHPGYLSTKLARRRASEDGLPLLEVQHHHAHVAACMAENRVPLGASPVLGVALDGLGYGEDGTIWGGEFLLATYTTCERLGTFKPVRMIGGDRAIHEPWRSLYAHLVTTRGWGAFRRRYRSLELFAWLEGKPRNTLDRMLETELNSPLASSCGRLFDAAAAAVGLCRERAGHEAEGAMMLEAAVNREALASEGDEAVYPFQLSELPESRLPYVDPAAMWDALLGDLVCDAPVGVIAARFHRGLARGIADMVVARARERSFTQVALTGGCFQNAILLELTVEDLTARGFDVLTHARVPTNDGGLALGQAAIGAAMRT